METWENCFILDAENVLKWEDKGKVYVNHTVRVLYSIILSDKGKHLK